MKILLIGHEEECNGASKSLINVAETLIHRGHDITVLTFIGKGLFYEALMNRRIETVVKPYYRWCIRKWNHIQWIQSVAAWNIKWTKVNRSTAMEMASYAVSNGIELIHTNSSVINIGALISKYSGIPHIWHIREFGDLDFDMYPLISRRRYYQFMNRNSCSFICISRAIFEHYDQLDIHKKRIIYNGIADYEFRSESGHRSDERTVTILIAGKILAAKGQDEAVHACDELLSRGISGFQLLIAGGGELYFEIPQRLIEHVRLLGQVEDMRSLRDDVDIELVCSKAEAFGRVTAEAMLCGIPVVGSNTGGTPELLLEGETGFLYEKGNVSQLADRIQYLIEHPKERAEMGHKAYRYAAKHFTIERCVDEIEAVYREVLEQPLAVPVKL